jgi:hypothetical protein
MATFPALVPSSRTFTPGEYPHTPFATYSGFQNRVRHGNVMLASQLRLSFAAVTEANMLSILAHYQGQLGTYDSFDLPSGIWSGVTPGDYQLTSYLWRYIEPPTVEDVYCNRFNIELALETVPPDGGITDGLDKSVIFSLAVGQALTTNGLNGTIAISLSAAGFEVPGITATVSISLASAVGIFATVPTTFAPGAASSPANANGADQSVTLSLADGAATVGTPSADYWSDMSIQLYGWEALAYIEWWGN